MQNTPHTFVTRLSALGLIKVSGIDAEKFLQGQLTCNVEEINSQQSQLGAHCDIKGRVQATFRLFKRHDDFYLLLPKSAIAHLLQCLKKYAVFSKVVLSEANDEFTILGIHGTHATAYLKTAFDMTLTADNAVNASDNLLAIQIPGITARYLVLSKINLDAPLKQETTPTDINTWKLLDITAGIPTIYPETVGEFTPHQINYQLINGISFNKGCYIGQEIVARMNYLGKLKQHMYRVQFNLDHLPKPGEKLYNATGEQIGNIVEVAQTTAGNYQALAVLPKNSLEQAIHVQSTTGPTLTILDLPYTL